MQRKEDVVREWYHYDAEGVVLGRLAVEIAKKLMGKEKVSFTPQYKFICLFRPFKSLYFSRI